MNSKEVRQSFLDFFAGKDHEIVPSAPVVPFDDPTLLFTNAGMNQFKKIFLGQESRDYKRVADTQKCIRVSGKHNDLEDVGFDSYHHTFFEMLGNWSFGDYFKREAIAWAWELLTEVWGLPKERIYATVFGGDQADDLEPDSDSEGLWKEVTNIDPSHVRRFGKKDNFWEMGETGPCGPCSEIHIDMTDDQSGGQLLNLGDPLVIEIWNLVFIQYNRKQGGALVKLPESHVDTGLGLERVAAIINGSHSNYSTDLFTHILSAIHEITGVVYEDSEAGIAHRVIADHIRALTFAIADGAIPSNEGRGYVLRRILRRAARFGRNLGMHDPFIYKLVPVIVDLMGDAFPELGEKHQFVSLVVKSEEESFNSTLDRGLEIFDKVVSDAKAAGNNEISGEEAFKLYDTYGFPLDLTQLMARQNDLTVDQAGFDRAMEGQRKRAREAGKWSYSANFEYDKWLTLSDGDNSKFLGYEQTESFAEIRKVLFEDDRALLTLSQTPFYGESGGQVGDIGDIIGDGFVIEVVDTIKDGNIFIHIGKVDSRDKLTNPKVTARVNAAARKSTARNHTATHLLHKALRETLGTHVSQAGSLVNSDRLRFDVNHFQKITREELAKIEARVNEKVRADIAVQTLQKSFVEAREMGAMAIFEEKYGERVRVVQIGDFSMELCGGTHLNRTGEIGYFRLLTESSAAAGIRRLEAVTGEKADLLLRAEQEVSTRAQELLHCREDQVVERIENLIDDRQNLTKELSRLRIQASRQNLAQLIDTASKLGDLRIVSSKIQSDSVEELKRVSDSLREKLGSGVGVLGTTINNKVTFVCVVTDDLISARGLKAGDIVKKVAAIAGGSGGGRPHIALAGAKDASKVDQALKEVPRIVSGLMKRE